MGCFCTGTKDRCRLSGVCKKWRRALSRPEYWQVRCSMVGSAEDCATWAPLSLQLWLLVLRIYSICWWRFLRTYTVQRRIALKMLASLQQYARLHGCIRWRQCWIDMFHGRSTGLQGGQAADTAVGSPAGVLRTRVQ